MPHGPALFVWIALFAIVLGFSPVSTWAEDTPVRAAGETLAELLERLWQHDLRESPLFATDVGDGRYNDQLGSVSLADSQRRHESDRAFLKELEAIASDQLTTADRNTYDIVRRRLREDIAEYEFQTHLTPITNRSGFHVEFPELRREVPLNTVADYENYLARLAAFDNYVRGHIELMRAGIAAEKTLPAVILQGYEPTLETHLVDDPEESLFYEPLQKFPAKVPAEEHARLRERARQAIMAGVVAGYRRFAEFMKNEYLPAARGSIGASALPDGRALYRHRVRRFTTLDITPQEVHQVGLREVARIRAEMDQIIRQVEFDGDFAQFVTYLRNEPRFYANSEAELLKEASFILKRIDGKLPELFGTLPRAPYGLRPIPAYIAPRTTSAYYMRPAGDGSRAGFFNLNTYNLKSRPLYSLEALSLHEAVPGHHLQLALQQELQDLPHVRRYSNCTAFIEGWALYAERLGLEAGCYADPYSNFGRLTMEIWRAARLVVDTGIHYFDWPRQKAIAYLADNSAMSQHNIEAEVDRYIGWPGQALAYKTGELKIRELREQAEQELGSRFDLRAFHDTVLGRGSVPLDVLERNVMQWIDAQQSTPTSPTSTTAN
jgi:uncharacterized protein (DUF885 family)